MCDGDGIGAGIFFRALARQQAALQHAAHHFGQGRTVDIGHLDQRGLAYAVIMLKRRQNHELLTRQVAAIGLARIEVAEQLLATPHQIGRCIFKLKAAVRLALHLRSH